MGATIIAVLSYAFQLAGALLLLLWCVGKLDAKIVKGCLDNRPDPRAGRFDKDGCYRKLSKEELQESAKNVYLNIATFANLVIGYTLAIFMTDVCIPRWCVLICVIVVVALILGFEHFIVRVIAKRKYHTDRKIYEDERQPEKDSVICEITGIAEDNATK